MPRRVTKMKARPITTEEFERMLSKVSDVVGAKCEESWKFLLRGLWASGLRLGEALNLSWDDETGFVVDLEGKRPMFRIAATVEKGKKNRLLPMAPEFSEMLESVPMEVWTGSVFAPQAERGGRVIRRVDTVSSIIVELGEKAGVKVSKKTKGNTKSASAHELRRSFGFRWAMRVMPPVLTQLMRHASI
jgi:integrase